MPKHFKTSFEQVWTLDNAACVNAKKYYIWKRTCQWCFRLCDYKIHRQQNSYIIDLSILFDGESVPTKIERFHADLNYLKIYSLLEVNFPFVWHGKWQFINLKVLH